MKDETVPERKKGLRRIFAALLYSFSGLKDAFFTETAFFQEILLTFILVPLAILLPIDIFYKVLIFFSNFIVLIVELLNTAIESTLDKVSPEFHLLAKRGKDMGSAAVLLSLLNLSMVWGFAIYQLFLSNS